MATYCGICGDLFLSLQAWLTDQYATSQELVFPYGNQYGWRIAHKRKKKLICNVFAEDQAFTVMIRLSDEQFSSVYQAVCPYTQAYIDDRYLSGDSGWIHYRITCKEHVEDIKRLLMIKCS